MDDGSFYGANYHGYVADTGTVDTEDYYNFSVTGTTMAMVITKGADPNVPVEWAPTQYEYIYDGVNHTPVISIQNLDGCESPYPTPQVCDIGFPPIPGDPYGSNSYDYDLGNFAYYPAYAVIYAHGTLVTEANVFLGDVLTSANTEQDWNHRVVYP